MLQLTGTVLLRHAGTQSIRPLQKFEDGRCGARHHGLDLGLGVAAEDERDGVIERVHRARGHGEEGHPGQSVKAGSTAYRRGGATPYQSAET